MLKILACIILLFTFFANIHPALATSGQFAVSDGQVSEAINNMPHVRFLPKSPLYYFIRGKELFSRFFTSSSVDRASFDFMMSSKRLREIYELYQQNRTAEIAGIVKSYESSADRSIVQLRKARSQNQEIIPAIDEIVSRLNYQEVLLMRMSGNRDLDAAISSFKNYVNELDNLKPGVKSRFKLISSDELMPVGAEDLPSPSPKISESSPSVRPRRIIY